MLFKHHIISIGVLSWVARPKRGTGAFGWTKRDSKRLELEFNQFQRGKNEQGWGGNRSLSHGGGDRVQSSGSPGIPMETILWLEKGALSALDSEEWWWLRPEDTIFDRTSLYNVATMATFSITFMQINLQHSSAVLARHVSKLQTRIVLVQEPWLNKGNISELRTIVQCFSANRPDVRACFLVKGVRSYVWAVEDTWSRS